jgi:gluconolactonase
VIIRRRDATVAILSAAAGGLLAVGCPGSPRGVVGATPSMPAVSGSVGDRVARGSRLHADPPVNVPVAAQDAPFGKPDATVDLAAIDGAALVHAQWRYSDVKIVPADGRAPGPDLKPSGKPIKTLDYEPKAGVAGFDDSAWPVVAPTALEERRAGGKVCFAWYRTKVRVPDRVGDLDTAGATIAFEIVIDDYAEVWVDGQLPRLLGQAGGQVVKGFNASNRVILTRDARPGQEIQLAVFAMNGPISASPENFIWVKSATLDFYKTPRTGDVRDSLGYLERLDPAVDGIVPLDAKIEKIAAGFLFTEGPVWSREERSLLFSDPDDNLIYRWTPDFTLSVFRPHSGYKGVDVGAYHQPGSNGITIDKQGRLTIDEHGNRRVIRLEKNGSVTVMADRYEGKRFNSPNDLVYKSDGSLYFTDPPFGLPKVFDDPKKELPYSGVFRVTEPGHAQLLTTDLTGPNGLAFSPDEKFFYVDDWDEKRKIVMRYAVQPDGTLADGRPFFDMGDAPEPEALDGMKIDQAGDLFVSGPGGVWILSPEGKHLGTLRVAELPANFAWGDDDGRTLYMTARTNLYRIRLAVQGIRP